MTGEIDRIRAENIFYARKDVHLIFNTTCFFSSLSSITSVTSAHRLSPHYIPRHRRCRYRQTNTKSLRIQPQTYTPEASEYSQRWMELRSGKYSFIFLWQRVYVASVEARAIIYSRSAVALDLKQPQKTAINNELNGQGRLTARGALNVEVLRYTCMV